MVILPIRKDTRKVLSSVFTSIILYALMVASFLAVLPLELMMDVEYQAISFYEEDGKEEKESEKEKKDKEEREKSEENNKKAKKYVKASRLFEADPFSQPDKSVNHQFVWESPILAVISPPPEYQLG